MYYLSFLNINPGNDFVRLRENVAAGHQVVGFSQPRNPSSAKPCTFYGFDYSLLYQCYVHAVGRVARLRKCCKYVYLASSTLLKIFFACKDAFIYIDIGKYLQHC